MKILLVLVVLAAVTVIWSPRPRATWWAVRPTRWTDEENGEWS